MKYRSKQYVSKHLVLTGYSLKPEFLTKGLDFTLIYEGGRGPMP